MRAASAVAGGIRGKQNQEGGGGNDHRLKNDTPSHPGVQVSFIMLKSRGIFWVSGVIQIPSPAKYLTVFKGWRVVHGFTVGCGIWIIVTFLTY